MLFFCYPVAPRVNFSEEIIKYFELELNLNLYRIQFSATLAVCVQEIVIHCCDQYICVDTVFNNSERYLGKGTYCSTPLASTFVWDTLFTPTFGNGTKCSTPLASTSVWDTLFTPMASTFFSELLQLLLPARLRGIYCSVALDRTFVRHVVFTMTRTFVRDIHSG